MQEWFNINRSTSVKHINKLKSKNFMVTSIESEIQHLFIIKITEQSEYREIILQHNKNSNDKPTANIILNCEKLKTFPLRSGTRQGYSVSPLLFTIVLQVLATAIRKNK